MILTILQTVSDPQVVDVSDSLLKEYGPVGLAFGVLLILILRQAKASETRISNLETAQQQQHMAHLDSYKQTVADYVTLVQNETKVLSDLTACLNAMKDTLERLERKKE